MVKENKVKKLFKKMFRRPGDKSLQISYSQQGEDLTLLRLLEGRNNGFYIDVGAYHPFHYSNTYVFYKHGWKGINIEPNPDIRAAFLKYRNRDLNLNVAVGNSNEKLAYHKFNIPAVNSFSKDHVEKWESNNGFHLVEVIDVQVERLQDILKKHLPKGQEIDFMTVDVENFDMEVLKSNDWNLYRPYLLLVEEDLLSYSCYSDSPIVSYLEGENYTLATICNGTLFFRDALKTAKLNGINNKK